MPDKCCVSPFGKLQMSRMGTEIGGSALVRRDDLCHQWKQNGVFATLGRPDSVTVGASVGVT